MKNSILLAKVGLQYVIIMELKFQLARFFLPLIRSLHLHLEECNRKKSKAKLAFKLQEQFDHTEKTAKKAQKNAVNMKKQAKQLLPQKENVS